jgi:hypothetical protein
VVAVPRHKLPPVVDVPEQKKLLRKTTKHTLTIRQGTRVEKHVFIKGEPNEDEDGPSGGSDAPPAPPAPPVQRPAPQPVETPAPKAPPSAFGGRRVPSRGN